MTCFSARNQGHSVSDNFNTKRIPICYSPVSHMHSIRIADPKAHFSVAHFVWSSGKLEPLHGHNYTVSIEIYGTLNDFGMVMDFRTVKEQLRRVCKVLDHKILLPGESTIIRLRDLDDAIEIRAENKRYLFPKEDCLILPITASTAELISEFIAGQLDIPEAFRLKVCVSESQGMEGCFERENKKQRGETIGH